MDRRGHTTAYGQACMQCFKAKTKCVARVDGDGCERCYRFKKHCHPSESIRRSNAQKNQTSAAKIAQLESKVDSLVSLLQSVVQSSGSSDALRKALENESLDANSDTSQQDSAGLLIPTPVSSTGTVPIHPTMTDSDDHPVPIMANMSPTSLTRSPSDMSSSNNVPSLPCELSPREAEEYLSVFRSKMLPYFAFIHIPTHLTAQQLQLERPFLYKAINTVVTPSTEQKLERGRELRRILAEVVIVENQSSLDLLLGLLTYITWGNDQFLNKGQSFSRLIQMAISLLRDLRLRKPMPREKQVFASIMSHPSTKHPAEVNDSSLEWKRVVLGCFVLHSVISTHFSHVEPPRWIPQMEEYLQAISTGKECSNDEIFAAQVRLQLLAQKAFRVREQQEVDSTQMLASTPLPTFLYLKALQVQLQELKASFPPEVQQQGIIIATAHYIELSIYEMADLTNNDPTTNNISTQGFERLEYLWQSLNAIKSWLDVFFSFSPSDCVGFSYIFWSQLLRSVMVLYKLSTYVDPAWDLQVVRCTLDLISTLDRVAEKLEQTSHEAGERSGDDIFAQVVRMTRTFKAWVIVETMPADVYGAGAANPGETMTDTFDFGGEMWMENFFGWS
ncbi:hypothetical protein F5884DRAFT_811358 [Xylogone sp. PMI_703]|nr:hypothetical protein F5884DRAFT_811358 [Xylogone sp. PMI_703]